MGLEPVVCDVNRKRLNNYATLIKSLSLSFNDLKEWITVRESAMNRHFIHPKLKKRIKFPRKYAKTGRSCFIYGKRMLFCLVNIRVRLSIQIHIFDSFLSNHYVRNYLHFTLTSENFIVFCPFLSEIHKIQFNQHDWSFVEFNTLIIMTSNIATHSKWRNKCRKGLLFQT